MGRVRNGFPLWWFFFLLSFIRGLTELYPEIYGEPDGNVSQYDINFAKKWKGYATVARIAEEDILKFDDVLNKPTSECLLFLCYLQDKSLVETMRHKETMKKYDKK